MTPHRLERLREQSRLRAEQEKQGMFPPLKISPPNSGRGSTPDPRQALIRAKFPCQHLGPHVDTVKSCTDLPVHECPKHGKVTRNPCTKFHSCLTCQDYSNAKWAYGVTCVPARFQDYLPQTIRSLKAAGFENPRLFLDGGDTPQTDFLGKRYGLPVTARYPAVKTYAHWMLSLWELYAREPQAKWYALFQDDCLAVKNLRLYFERGERPEKAYFNLITHYENEEFPRSGVRGWVESKPLRSGQKYFGKMQQGGRGAVGLVFPREAVWELLGHARLINRVLDLLNGTSRVDGAVVESMNQLGWREYVHCPSLLQHIGTKSSMSAKKHPQALSFPGEEVNALDWLK